VAHFWVQSQVIVTVSYFSWYLSNEKPLWFRVFSAWVIWSWDGELLSFSSVMENVDLSYKHIRSENMVLYVFFPFLFLGWQCSYNHLKWVVATNPLCSVSWVSFLHYERFGLLPSSWIGSSQHFRFRWEDIHTSMEDNGLILLSVGAGLGSYFARILARSFFGLINAICLAFAVRGWVSHQ